MSMETSARLAEQFVHTFGRPSETMALLAPDATWWLVPSAGVGLLQYAAIEPFLNSLYTQILKGDSIQVTVDEVMADDTKAVVRFRMDAESPSGRPYHNVHAMFLTLRDGQVTGVRDYGDVAHALQQLTSDLEAVQEIARVEVVRSDLVEVHTSIEIDAPHGVVWSTLTDFEHLADWSDSFVACVGDFRPGGHIRVTFRLPFGFDTNPEHDVKFFEAGQQFGWSDPLGLGMTDQHIFRVEPLPGGRTRFIQNDHFQGGATHLMGRTLASQMSDMYKRFNRQLKEESERRAKRA